MVIMAIVDIMLAFPIVIFAMGLIISLGTGVLASIIAIGIAGIPLFSRITRGRHSGHPTEPGRGGGLCRWSGDRRIMLKHVFPNVQPGIIVFATLGIGNALLIVAALSFIGLGGELPTAEWGLMVYEGTESDTRGDWWMATFPVWRSWFLAAPRLQPDRRWTTRHNRPKEQVEMTERLCQRQQRPCKNLLRVSR